MKKLIFVFGILITGTVFGQTAKFKLTDTTGRWNTGNDYLDSLKQEFIQEEIVKQLNAIRVADGMKPLVLDTGLRPAAIHNATYNAWCFKNKIYQPTDPKCIMTHEQYVDMPNFDEIPEPFQRIKLLDRSRFQSMTEELTEVAISNIQGTDTYQKRVTHVLNNYKACYDGHWKSMTKNTKWDAIYVYFDINYSDNYDSQNAIVYVILGSYADGSWESDF